MTNIAPCSLTAYHVANVRAGQPDPHRANDALSAVSYDQKTDYYDFAGQNVTADEFLMFVNVAWDHDNYEDATLEDVVEWVPGVYRINLD